MGKEKVARRSWSLVFGLTSNIVLIAGSPSGRRRSPSPETRSTSEERLVPTLIHRVTANLMGMLTLPIGVPWAGKVGHRVHPAHELHASRPCHLHTPHPWVPIVEWLRQCPGNPVPPVVDVGQAAQGPIDAVGYGLHPCSYHQDEVEVLPFGYDHGLVEGDVHPPHDWCRIALTCYDAICPSPAGGLRDGDHWGGYYQQHSCY